MKRRRSYSDVTPLASKAAEMGNEQDLPHTIRSSFSVGMTDSRTLLHEAATHMDVEELKCDSTEGDRTPLLIAGKEKYHEYHEAAENSVPLLLQNQIGAKANLKCTECIQIILEYNANQNLNKFWKFLLIAAAKDGHVECLKTFLACNVDPNVILQLQVIPLIVAVRNGNPECVKILLDYSAKQNLRMEKFLKYLLFTAAKNGYAECLKILLDCNVHSNLNRKSLEILLMAASKNGHSACVKALLDFHADPNIYIDEFLEEPFLCAVESDRAEYVNILCVYVADPMLNTNELSETPLISAAKKGHAECVKLLHEHNTDPNLEKYQLQGTPLIAAANNGHTTCVEILLDYNAYPNLGTENCPQTPLIAAAKKGHVECIKVLLNYGADPNMKNDILQESPLIAAVQNDHAECAKILLDYNADPDFGKGEFDTPLCAAARGGYVKCAKLLLDYIACPDSEKAPFLEDPFMLAAYRGYAECAKFLLDYKTDSSIRANRVLWVCLTITAENGHAECVKVILDYISGSNHSHKYENPLIAATTQGHTECVKILLDYSADQNCSVQAWYMGEIVRAVCLAVFHGYSACLKLLLDKIEHSCVINSLYFTENLSPLHVAVRCRRHEYLKNLLSCGFLVDGLNSREENMSDEMFASFSYHNTLAQSDRETALSLAVSIGDLESIKILLEHGASVNTFCYSLNDGVHLEYSYPPIFNALLREEGIPEFLIEHGCDISYHREGIPTNECLLFSIYNYDSFRDLLKWGSDPHLLFQKGSVCFVNYLTADIKVLSQDEILDILDLLLQFTAVTEPVRSSFHAVSAKCREILKAQDNAQRWNEILMEVDKPSSLKNLCRVKIRRLTISKNGYSSFRTAIHNLCLPQMLKKYLLYSKVNAVLSS